MGIRSWLIINSNNVIINGERIFTDVSGKDLLKFLYRREIKDYPKFYKMDVLCRLGIVASEMLINSVEIDESDKENMSIILFNKSGSLLSNCYKFWTLKFYIHFMAIIWDKMFLFN